MKKNVLYVGDSILTGPASYLAGVMTYYNISFDYLPSGIKFVSQLLVNNYDLIILSDYPSANFTPPQLNAIAEKIKLGTGLLMIGGWDSFTGLNGNYNTTVLKDILPIEMLPTDDRVNYCQTCLIKKEIDHPIIESIPFDTMTPAVGGFNILKAKPDALTILSTQRFENSFTGKKFNFTPLEKTDPLLVVGQYENARVAALATDLAPHWVGPFVDYGSERITAKAQASQEIEVGNYYAQFVANLVKWTANL